MAASTHVAAFDLSQRQRLLALADDWSRIARRKFVNAEAEIEPGKTLIAHGALCYKNCADELRAALDGCELRVSQAQSKGRT
jgi:hypothetical protein